MRGFFVGLLGLEPRKTAPKTVVLPLHHRPAVRFSECKFSTNFKLHKFFRQIYSKKMKIFLKKSIKQNEQPNYQKLVTTNYFCRK